MDDIRWRFICRDKTEPVSTLLWGFGDLVAAKGRCYCLLVFVYVLACACAGLSLYGGGFV